MGNDGEAWGMDGEAWGMSEVGIEALGKLRKGGEG